MAMELLPRDLRHELSFFRDYRQNKAEWNRVKKREGVDGKVYTYTLRGFVEKECIFIAVPRAASSSICQCVFGHMAGGHKTAKEYRRLFGPWFRWHFVFTFVRNPYTRLVSAYDYLRKGGHPAWPKDKRFGEEVIGSYDGFDDFVLQWLRPEKAPFKKDHFRPQTHFLEIDGRLAVDFIGSVEKIEEDYEQIREKIRDAAPLQKRNTASSNRKPLEAFYTNDRVVRRVREVYSLDFERLGYSLDIADINEPPENQAFFGQA